MNCPSCGAPMRTEDAVFKCDYCHNVVVPVKDDAGVSVTTESDGEACPVCSIPLMKATLGRLPLLYCTKCDGMEIAMDQFQDLIAASRAVHPGACSESPADASDLRRILTCPHCHRPMEAHFYGGPGDAIIDTCESCSLNWLDHGVLARIAEAPVSDFPPEEDSDSAQSEASYPELSPAARPVLSDAKWKADL